MFEEQPALPPDHDITPEYLRARAERVLGLAQVGPSSTKPELYVDDGLVTALHGLRDELALPEDVSVIDSGSHTQVGAAQVFGREHVVHVDPDELAVGALTDAGYQAVPERIEDYQPDAPADLMVALNSYGKPGAETVERLVKPGGYVITNNYTGWAHDLAELPGLQLVGAIMPSYHDSEAAFVPGNRLPEDATDISVTYQKVTSSGKLSPAAPGETGAYAEEDAHYPDALFVFRSDPEVVRGSAHFRYISCWHSPENGQAVAEQARGAQIVAVEAFGLTADARSDMEAIYTRMLTRDFAARPEAEKEAVYDRIRDPKYEATLFLVNVLKGLEGSEATVRLLDIGLDNPDARFTLDATHRIKVARSAVRANDPNTEIRQRTLEAAAALARSFIPRNEAIKVQLESIENDNPGAVVAVVAGAVHTSPEINLPGGEDAERIFVDAFGAVDSEPHGQYLEDIAARASVGINSTEDDLRRAMLQTMYDVFFTDHPPKALRHLTEYQRVAHYRTIIDAMTSQQVEGLLNRLDRAKGNTVSFFAPNMAQVILKRTLTAPRIQ